MGSNLYHTHICEVFTVGSCHYFSLPTFHLSLSFQLPPSNLCSSRLLRCLVSTVLAVFRDLIFLTVHIAIAVIGCHTIFGHLLSSIPLDMALFLLFLWTYNNFFHLHKLPNSVVTDVVQFCDVAAIIWLFNMVTVLYHASIRNIKTHQDYFQ